MTRLHGTQIQDKIEDIFKYIDSGMNPADSSKVDANANVTKKNLATLSAELHKPENIQINRGIAMHYLEAEFGKDISRKFLQQLEDHELYDHDASSLFPYCVAIDSTPFLHQGLTTLGGDSTAPHHLDSYCGGYVNLIYTIAGQFAGAVADVSFLKDFHYFAKGDFGDDYLETQTALIKSCFNQVIYSINMPAGSRGFQSIFYNTSVFDEAYFKGLYESAYYPNGTSVADEWEGVSKLQKFFLSWFNAERDKSLLTFPVITAALKLDESQNIESEEYKEVIAQEFSEGNSFFIYMDEDVSSLSSCCRLKNNIKDQLTHKNTFSASLGFGGVSTGSKNVMTINMNRLVQDGRDLVDQLQDIYKYQCAYEMWFRKLKSVGMLPIYDAGYISLDKQYLTIGINGLVEAAEYLGMTADYNSDYVGWLSEILDTISEENKKASKFYSEKYGYKIMFNTEFVPAENLGVKNYKWDKADGYWVPESRNLYNSYFYPVENHNIDIIDKMKLHGKETIKFLDGGSALHINLEEFPTADGFKRILESAAKAGANYWCYNVPTTICNVCDHIDKRNIANCSKCGSADVDKAVRIIGYLRRVSNFSNERRIEAGRRMYHSSTGFLTRVAGGIKNVFQRKGESK